MSISIKDILETISETREALITDYIEANSLEETYHPTSKELLKHIVFLYKENIHLDLLGEINALDDCSEEYYAALLLVSAAKLDSDTV